MVIMRGDILKRFSSAKNGKISLIKNIMFQQNVSFIYLFIYLNIDDVIKFGP